MPDFDFTRPSPDAGHEAIRVAVVEAVDNLGANFDLVDLLFLLIDELMQRVAAIENP